MTATLTRPRSPHGGGRQTEPSPWIRCPCCDVVTVEVLEGGRLRFLRTASGYEDGARCRVHRRDVEQRQAETRRALAIALYRGCGIDDTAQGCE